MLLGSHAGVLRVAVARLKELGKQTSTWLIMCGQSAEQWPRYWEAHFARELSVAWYRFLLLPSSWCATLWRSLAVGSGFCWDCASKGLESSLVIVVNLAVLLLAFTDLLIQFELETSDVGVGSCLWL